MSSGSRLLNLKSASSLKSQSVSINGIRELSDLEQSDRKDLFTETAGLVASHGEPWYEVRSKVQQDMMRPKSAMYYINDIEEISQQLVDLMTANVDSEGEVEDIVKHIQCWSLESTAAIFLDTRLGVLDPNLPEDSEGRRFIRAVNVFLGPDFNDLNMGLPIWKYVPTPGYRRWDRSQLTIFQITKKYVDAALERFQQQQGEKEEGELSVLERMIARCGVGSQIPLVMAQDALTAGVDTTGSSVAFLLLNLANNPAQQEELFQEIQRVVGEGREGNITESKLNQMKYLKACLHESQRLNLGATTRGIIVSCFTRNLSSSNLRDGYEAVPNTTRLIHLLTFPSDTALGSVLG